MRKILGRDDIGSLEVNKAADLFMINTKRIELAGAHLDPKSMLGTVGFNRPVDYTIVNGKIVVKNGELCNIDEYVVTEQANKLVKKLVNA